MPEERRRQIADLRQDLVPDEAGGSLLRRFALGALLVFALVGGVLYAVVNARALDATKQQGETYAKLISGAITGAGVVVVEDDGTISINPSQAGNVAAAFQPASDAWERVRVYGADGKPLIPEGLYLGSPGPPDETGLEKALAGETYQMTTDNPASLGTGLSEGEKLVTYVPFQVGDQVIGALQLIQQLSDARSAAATDLTRNLIILAVALAVLYIALLPIVARASRVQQAQQRIAAALLEREREQVARLEELDAAKDDLLAFSAHEFRTPLTSLLGFAQTLRTRRDELSDELVDDYLETIVRQARRLQRVANDFLDAAAIEAGRMEVVSSSLMVGDVVKGVVAEFAHDDVQLVVEEDVRINADRGRLEQVLTNLVRNALQHGPPDGSVEVHSRVHDDMCEIDISDEGTGVPVHLERRIFQKFERGAGRSKGSGLGLYLSRALMDAQGGSLELVPDTGRTTFRVRIPMASAFRAVG